MLNCEYSARCIRYAYSRYLLDKGYDIPPNRVVLCCEGYADIGIVKHGMFAENMPLFRDGQAINLCPAMIDQSPNQCPEHIKEAKRLTALAKARAHSQQYFNARPRVWIPEETRKEVSQRDRYTCVYCHRHQNQSWKGKKIKFHVDHYIPLALGGNEKEASNLVFSCEDCNQAKGTEVWNMGCRVGYYHEC